MRNSGRTGLGSSGGSAWPSGPHRPGQSPGFTSKQLDRWAYEHEVELAFIQPGKPVQNAFVESFNGTMRNEYLNEHWFLNLADAREIIEGWRIDYNLNRPHSSARRNDSDRVRGFVLPERENDIYHKHHPSTSNPLSL